MRKSDNKLIMPDYPSVNHLPWKPNTARGDRVVSEKEASVIFRGHNVYVQEKVDGANSAIAKVEDEPVIRNVDHVLRKGYFKNTPAKAQFRPIWNWYYDHEKCFDKLADYLGEVSVYGEWMVAQHGMKYDLLPDWFVAFEVFNYGFRQAVDPSLSQPALEKAGFSVVPMLATNPTSYEELEELCNQPSAFATDGQREGIFVKVGNGRTITHRFKMVRQGFVQGSLWDKKKLNKNSCEPQ